MPLPTPKLTFFCTLEVGLSAPLDAGEGNAGRKRIIPIKGGKVTGPDISGHILDIGADWQTVFETGVAELDARYAFQTDDGAVIEIRNFGFRHGPKEVLEKLAAGENVPPGDYYMRTAAILTTGHPDYAWINRTMFVGTGARLEKSVQLDLYAVE